jgi:thioredoxin 1
MIESKRQKAGTDSKHIVTITDANIDKVTSENELILIDFWNERCEYCKELAPIIEGLAADYVRRVAFGKLDVDKNRSTHIRFKVQAFPTLLILKKGIEVDRIVGYVPRELIEAALKKQLNPRKSTKGSAIKTAKPLSVGLIRKHAEEQ